MVSGPRRAGRYAHPPDRIRCMTTIRLAAVATALYLLVTGTATVAQRGGAEHWVGTWATAPVARPQAAPGAGQGRGAAPLNFNNQTLRQVVHISVGGNRRGAQRSGRRLVPARRYGCLDVAADHAQRGASD